MDTNYINKNIALVEFRLSGHHPYYLATFARQFTEIGCNVDIFVHDIAECRQKLLNAIPNLKLDNIGIHETSAASMGKRILGCRSYFRLKVLNQDLNEIEEKHNKSYDLVFFPYIDDLVQYDLKLPYFLKTPFKREFSGLLMEPRSRLMEKPGFPINLLTSTWLELPGSDYKELGLLVEDTTSQVSKLLGKPVVHYPDFCSTGHTAQPNDTICKEITTKRNGRYITSLLGSISPYKSLDLFLECVNEADPQKHMFVIAGYIWKNKFSTETLARLEPLFNSQRENVLVFDQWIPSEAVFDTIVQYSDVLFAHYRNFRKSSNILSKAAYYSKPAIVSDKFLLGQRVSEYKLGFSLPEDEIPALYNTDFISNWTTDSEKREQFVSVHSESRLESIFQHLVA